jgi:hypothetical protein
MTELPTSNEQLLHEWLLCGGWSPSTEQRRALEFFAAYLDRRSAVETSSLRPVVECKGCRRTFTTHQEGIAHVMCCEGSPEEPEAFTPSQIGQIIADNCEPCDEICGHLPENGTRDV